MNYYNYPFNPVFTNQPTFTNGGNFYFVNNKQEAENWIVNPDSTVYLFDRNNKQFFIKTVEKSGQVKPLEVYTYEQTEVVKTPGEYATKQDIENLREELKELKNEYSTNDEPDTTESTTTTTTVISEGQD
jgi:hypothetical protein